VKNRLCVCGGVLRVPERESESSFISAVRKCECRTQRAWKWRRSLVSS